MSGKKEKLKGGSKKHGRNKRPVDSATSLYVKGRISFESYAKRKGIKFKVKK
jgi:hypothetical protein